MGEDLSTENLVYLTSQQALRDLAFFIEAMNQKYNLTRDVKWIVFGGSYSGNLAAWLRLKYPHLVHGAMSASAPLLAKLDFPEFLKDVAHSIRANNIDCFIILEESSDQVDVLNIAVGQKKLTNGHNYLNMYPFFMQIVTKRATIDLCEKVYNSIESEINLRKLTYYELFSKIKNISWEANDKGLGARQWVYQTCTEFGYFQTSHKAPLSFFIRTLCQNTYRSSYNEMFVDHAINRTNVLYGGLDIEVSNVVFVHGSVDPWRLLGITKTLNDKAPAILIEGAGHCENMFGPSYDDTPPLMTARVQIGELIGTWINS
uniref:LOW QUALITY PROTEIN: thymus-specific serine protease-like n=1 Tax=Diabrotica virgifera virgifera TaxID=50390 RepID=A0A6P7GNB5_DIAVI